MFLAQGQGKLPALLIARLKSLHLIGPVIHEGIIQRGSLSKTQIGSFDYKKNNGGRVTNELSESSSFVPEMKFDVALTLQNYHCHQEVNSKLIAMRFEATLSLKMRKTSLCHVDPLLCGDGLALNTVRCLVPGCILTNERLLLGFGGQSTYSAVNSESKKSCSARTQNVQIPQGVNLINYLWLEKYSFLSTTQTSETLPRVSFPLLKHA